MQLGYACGILMWDREVFVHGVLGSNVPLHRGGLSFLNLLEEKSRCIILR